MIYPQANNASAGGSAGKRAGKNSSFADKRGVACRKNGKGGKPRQVVQWKQKNVEEGIVVVDEQQLSKLIKREPIERYYTLDPEPFATGLFATVRRCVSLDTGEVFAAKFSSRARYGEDCSAEIHHEIALLSLCAPSPRIVKLHDVFETPTEIIILMQFAPGGDLQTVIDDNLVPFETDVVNFVRQLVEGLAYLHERKIAHLDIKPQNLVMMGDFPNCDVKLCDFEISRVILEGTEIREILGTPDYVAPEILHYEPITLAADLWSLGVTTYVLLTGFSPFGGETDQETFCNISRAQLDFPEELFEDVSQDAKDFIRQLLVREPGARPAAKTLLKHRWLCRPPVAPHRAATPGGGEKNLRKYLSKSREALFERVVQQQQQQQRGDDLRKTTLLSQCNKTRMCESHTSLVSRVRDERPLVGLSPSFSRSREKLYGLRSLSRSHETLNLLRLGGREGGGRRAYARATTADLGMLPLHAPPPAAPATPSEDKTFRKINSDSCIAVPTLVSPTLVSPSLVSPTLVSPTLVSPSLVSPSLLRNTLEQCAKLMTATPAAPQVTPTTDREKKQNGIANDTDKFKLTSTTTALDANTTANQDKKQNGIENNEDKTSKPTFTLTALDVNTIIEQDKRNNGIANNEHKSKLSTTDQEKKQNGIANNEEESKLTGTTTALDVNTIASQHKKQNGIANYEDKKQSGIANNEGKTSKPTITPAALDVNTTADQYKTLNGIVNNEDKKQNSIANNEDKTSKPTITPAALDVNTTADQYKTLNGVANNEDKTSNEPTSKRDTTPANHVVQSSIVESHTNTREAFDDTARTTNVIADEPKERADGAMGQQQTEGNREGEGRETGAETVAMSTDRQEGPKSSDAADAPGPDKEETDEPSFTVAQLISAYNRHQEVVTKSSLEVTMTAGDKATNPREPSAGFPTGPTALRLFIPDIDIEPTKRKKNRTKSYRTLIARSGTAVAPVVREAAAEAANRVGVAVTPATCLDGAPRVPDPPAPDFLRSVSLSSETSGGLTPSETLSSLSWEELAPETPDAASPAPATGVANPWGRLCNGSYTRAMERFGGQQPKTETTETTANNNNARKCSLSMLFPRAQQEDEKVRRKSTSVIVKLS